LGSVTLNIKPKFTREVRKLYSSYNLNLKW
jgi:hypothetical protein